MNQVVCRPAPFEIACEGFGIRKIRLPDLHSGILSPFAALQLRRPAERDNGWTKPPMACRHNCCPFVLSDYLSVVIEYSFRLWKH